VAAVPTPPPEPIAEVLSSEPTKPAERSHEEAVAIEAKPETSPVTAHMEPSPNANVRGRLVIIARDGGEGPSYPFHDVADIGRVEGHIVIADDRYISPRHARLTRRGEHIYLRDLASANGVYLRIQAGLGGGGAPAGSAVGGGSNEPSGPPGGGAVAGLSPSSGAADATSPAVVLQDQDLFLVGQQVLMFEAVKDVEEGFGAASQHGTLLFGTPVTPRYARLSQRTVEGVTRDVFYIRKAETVLGRETGDIVFTDDPFLSRRHAVVRMTTTEPTARGGKPSRRFTLADLGSSNGTFLKIREEVRLNDGDHFRIGQQLFRVDLDVTGRSPVAPAGRGT
jgi:pSer/pThr/pTyr-binding forkhead associated (FHA) protein